MSFVVDASVAASWLLPDEGHPVAKAAYSSLMTDYALVPALWWFEMRNIFLSAERRGRISRQQTERALALLTALPIRQDHAPNEATLFRLATEHRLTAYDSAYLELAQRENVPLATLDVALIHAARTEGVDLMGNIP